jgi:hypothetical protein
MAKLSRRRRLIRIVMPKGPSSYVVLEPAKLRRDQVRPQLLLRHDRLRIAIDTMELVPINGLRIPALSGSSGWFIYGGCEPSEDPSYYQPLRVTHIRKYCEIAIPYLCLPAGWRFQVDADGYEDVWYDKKLVIQHRDGEEDVQQPAKHGRTMR